MKPILKPILKSKPKYILKSAQITNQSTNQSTNQNTKELKTEINQVILLFQPQPGNKSKFPLGIDFRRSLNSFFSIVVVISLNACVRAPIKSADQALRVTKDQIEFNDDLPLSSLAQGLSANIKRLKELGEAPLYFGPKKISAENYAICLEHLLTNLFLTSSGSPTPVPDGWENNQFFTLKELSGERFRAALKSDFEVYEIYGRKKWGEVFLTSYYEPIIEGSKIATPRFNQPIYGVPDDLVEIDLGEFLKVRPSLSAIKDLTLEQRSQAQILRARLADDTKDPKNSKKIVPYYSRAEITSGNQLKGKARVLAWIDRIDAFFLEIQGSGVVRFEDKSELPVGYAAQNGHPYTAIGKHLFHVIPREKMSIQTIENHLRTLSGAEADKIMNLNSSYVFFRRNEKGGVTFFGTNLVEGRSIATDQTYFPKGALAFLEFEKPVFNSPAEIEPSRWQKTTRFVLDQDTGGAIRGADRLDLYWGRGANAKQAAGVVKNFGRLVYFFPKDELLAKLGLKVSKNF